MFNDTTTEVATRPEAGAEKVTTNLTIDWSGMTAEDVQALAQAALVVKLQGAWRSSVKAGTGVIPSGDLTVKAVDHKVGTRAPKKPADVAALFAALSQAERDAILAKYA